jgi:hypothetical protein
MDQESCKLTLECCLFQNLIPVELMVKIVRYYFVDSKKYINSIQQCNHVKDSFSPTLNNAMKLWVSFISYVPLLLEIILAAEDKDFHPSLSPTLIMELTKKDLIVKYNDLGLEPKNVDEICHAEKQKYRFLRIG